MNMVLLSLTVSSHTNALISDVHTKALGSDVLVNDALRSTRGCRKETSHHNGMASCAEGYNVHAVEVSNSVPLVISCCPLSTVDGG